MNQIGLVAIGRNEGQRLRQCLLSAFDKKVALIVYVDSDSTDGSAELAWSLESEVIFCLYYDLKPDMKLIDFFERAYVINLPNRKDRRRMMIQELKKIEMPLTPNKTEIFPASRPDDAGAFPSVGARGCFLSHLAILKRAKEERLSNVLIIEDDLTISGQLKTNQESLVDQLRSTDWGFVYFGHVEESVAVFSTRLRPFSGPIMTTHFYGVNSLVFDRLLSFLEALQRRPAGHHPDGGPMHLDGAYSTFRAQNPDIVTLLASANLGWQRNSRSDIASNKWFEQVPVFKQLVGAARAGKVLLKAGIDT